jgi:hypothetical protein
MGCAVRDRRWCCARLKIFERERASVREEKERQLTDPLVSCEIPSQSVGFAAPAWLEVCFAVDCKIFLSFFFCVFCFWPICDFVLDLLFAVAALCGFLLRCRGSRCCPLWVSSLLSWVSSLPFVGLRRLGPPLSWISVEMREKEPEMRSRKSWAKKKNNAV